MQASDRVPSIGLWDSIQQTGKEAYRVADAKLNPLSRKIERATGHKFNLSKLVPITLALLITPMPLVLGAFAVGAVIRIIHPSSFNQNAQIATTLSHAVGLHGAIYAIGYAILLADPANMALHLGICAAAFMFAKEIQNEGFQEKFAGQDARGLGHKAPTAHLEHEGEGEVHSAEPFVGSRAPAPAASASLGASVSIMQNS